MRISDWSSDVCSSDLVVGGMAGCRGQHVVVESVVEPGQPDTVAEIAHQHGKRRQGDCDDQPFKVNAPIRSEEHTSELQSLMRISYAVFCLKKKTTEKTKPQKK